MSIRGPISRFLDPERSRFSRATITLLSISAWINNTLAFLFWVVLQLNNLGVWAEANGFWFVVLLLFAPLFITLLGLFWQLLAIPLVLLAAIVHSLWAEAFRGVRGTVAKSSNQKLKEASDASRPAPPMTALVVGNVKNIAEGLRELAKLRDEGTLTQEEYEAKRRQLAEGL